MTRLHSNWSAWKVAMTAATLVTGVLGDSILRTSGVTDCGSDPGIRIEKLDISYDNDKQVVTFDVSGTSEKEQNVSAILEVNAYGRKVYENSINPCSSDTPIPQLCPLPNTHFAAQGSQDIKPEWANQVPAIAFQVPDISAQATLRLVTVDDPDKQVACFQTQVNNGKTASVPAVTYVSVGVVGAALLVSGASAASSTLSGTAGAGNAGGAPSPSFAQTLGWFQGMAMNGMLSVDYPPVYRSFVKNFGFSAGMIPWGSLQRSIDSMRNSTGGDLTNDSFDLLRNATLVFSDNSTSTPEDHSYKVKRAFNTFESLANLAIRGVETSMDNATEGDASTAAQGQTLSVSGISAFVQQYSVPKSNTFMMVLLIVAIIIAVIIVGILLVKAILEFWALFGNFPQSLAGFREHYWGSIARTITHLILVLYGIWVLYCVFQFTVGDSWLAQALAGVTLFLFTAILGWFTWKIFSTVKRLRSTEGNADALYNDKQYWVKYSLFYESYKKEYWWIFIPTIVYLFAKGCTLAVGDGHGFAQTIAQLVVESIMLALLIFTRPFERKSSNVIGISIQTVRVLSVACILIFVHELKIPQDSKTIAGVVLIAIQSALTGLLVILIIWNAINVLVKENPHRKRRKEMGKSFWNQPPYISHLLTQSTEKAKREMDTLTPLDARNSLLLDRKDNNNISMFSMPAPQEKAPQYSISADQYHDAEAGYRQPNYLSSSPPTNRNLTNMDHDSQNLMGNAAPPGWSQRDPSPVGRQDSGDMNYYQQQPQQPYGYGNGGGYRGF